MRTTKTLLRTRHLLAALALPLSAVAAQGQVDPNIVVEGEVPVDPATLAAGPDIKGVISARSGNRLQVTAADGSATVIQIAETTRIRAGGGLFGSTRAKIGPEALLNGLPVTIKTLQAGGSLLASQITFKNGDLKTATMIRAGTAQGFAEQSAATEALRGRMGDIDKYNIKRTSNVYFDTGRAVLSPQAKAELCATAAEAEATDNALMLVVGYTDSVGSEEYNQLLSEKRAGSVINYLQQACHWKPYRMLTPTGMAEADPLASNDTAEGKAQNRRVSVNVLVSKGLDGL
ncbi:OmpA family protein [Novosphingobium sp. MMS21-SN21R]|uniref:OmpA family protein n=1 Tax=Novosphingobium sp. MMS21-SN21R TaxID=2969298 RepID=UPI0028860896|nr:OmpA family protein [Novosphingobium sp. MMS21-SN21R]MDT0508683.1 OmpA family protein [Novosphingobium sp. MMS21-SN21R]